MSSWLLKSKTWLRFMMTTYPNFPVVPKIASDISFGLTLSNEVPFGISHTCTNDDSNPPEISRVSIPAALLDRGFHMRCLFSI